MTEPGKPARFTMHAAMNVPGQPYQLRHVPSGKLVTDPDGRPVQFTSAMACLKWAREVLSRMADQEFRKVG